MYISVHLHVHVSLQYIMCLFLSQITAFFSQNVSYFSQTSTKLTLLKIQRLPNNWVIDNVIFFDNDFAMQFCT